MAYIDEILARIPTNGLGEITATDLRECFTILDDATSPTIGTTSERPTLIESNPVSYFDTDLNKPIWFNGADWVDATGTTV